MPKNSIGAITQVIGAVIDVLRCPPKDVKSQMPQAMCEMGPVGLNRNGRSAKAGKLP